ncbi:hypothetical protein [Flavobacterium cheongpyeongense]|jgi:hypothetical protein|uniref:hypothetical protein n=1 Tax=Flavobacterium cheongpyeongense TaxID=2212651 RepID=UPI0014038484|nr:hypothetical protein [Flavobacterium cheongpyeongense]
MAYKESISREFKGFVFLETVAIRSPSVWFCAEIQKDIENTKKKKSIKENGFYK